MLKKPLHLAKLNYQRNVSKWRTARLFTIGGVEILASYERPYISYIAEELSKQVKKLFKKKSKKRDYSGIVFGEFWHAHLGEKSYGMDIRDMSRVDHRGNHVRFNSLRQVREHEAATGHAFGSDEEFQQEAKKTRERNAKESTEKQMDRIMDTLEAKGIFKSKPK